MYLQSIIKSVFLELEDVLLQMSNEQYSLHIANLNSSVGGHVRHTIELFQSLLNGYDDGIVNYDKRKRDKAIESEKAAALNAMQAILQLIEKPNKKMTVEASFGMQNEIILIESNFHRELAYNLEHAIHHMALIRVGVNEFTNVIVSEKFGVAASTLKFRAGCAQ